MKDRRDGYFQISLMNVFRQAAADRDAKAQNQTYTDGDRVLNQRSIERREGAGQEKLRSHLAQDLANLLSTIHLEAAQPLTGLDRVRRSILNYGMQDMTRLTATDVTRARILADIKTALLTHEPRLIAETLVLKVRDVKEDGKNHIAFDISAEMAARPVDVPLEFVAEIDVGAGKVALASLRVQG